MKIHASAFALLTTLSLIGCSQAASTPEALAKAVQSAFSKGDFDAARKLADIGDAPADLHFYYFDAVRECAGEAVCTVSTAPGRQPGHPQSESFSPAGDQPATRRINPVGQS